MPIIIKDLIGLHNTLLASLLVDGSNPSTPKKQSIEYALDLLSSKHSAEDIAISIIFVEGSIHGAVSTCANNIIPALGFIAEHERVTAATEPFSGLEREKAREIYECYRSTKHARELDSLFGTVACLTFYVHRPQAIADALAPVFGGVTHPTPGGGIRVEKLPWGSLEFVPIGDGSKCRGSAVTFKTNHSPDFVLEYLHSVGIETEGRIGKKYISFRIVAEYEDDHVDHINFIVEF